MKLWELNSLIRELKCLGSSEFTIRDNSSSDDLNGFSSSTMSSTHFHVHLRDCTAKGNISKLLVHVHSVCTCCISENNSVVLDVAGFLFENLTRQRLVGSFSHTYLAC